MCAESNGVDRILRPCFEDSTRENDSSKNLPNRLRCDRAREFRSLAPTSRLTGRFLRRPRAGLARGAGAAAHGPPAVSRPRGDVHHDRARGRFAPRRRVRDAAAARAGARRAPAGGKKGGNVPRVPLLVGRERPGSEQLRGPRGLDPRRGPRQAGLADDRGRRGRSPHDGRLPVAVRKKETRADRRLHGLLLGGLGRSEDRAPRGRQRRPRVDRARRRLRQRARHGERVRLQHRQAAPAGTPRPQERDRARRRPHHAQRKGDRLQGGDDHRLFAINSAVVLKRPIIAIIPRLDYVVSTYGRKATTIV